MRIKVLKKTGSLLLAFTVTTLMLCGMMTTAFATVDTSNGPVETAGAAGTSLKASITKKLETPYGTALTNPMNFSFAVTQVNNNGSALSGTEVAEYPKTVTINGAGGTKTTSGDVDTYSKESADLFASVTSDDWKAVGGAGEYTFLIKETAGSTSMNWDGNSNTTETTKYSTAQYLLHAWVAYDTASGQYYIKYIGDVQTYADKFTVTVGGSKVDPTPGGNNTTNDGNSDMEFTNSYVVQKSGTPDTPNPNASTLTINKMIAGEFADAEDEFTFNVKVSTSSLFAKTSYTGQVYDTNGSSDPSTWTKVGSVTTFHSNQSTEVTMKGDYVIVFSDVEVGATISCTENASSGYTTTNVVTAGDVVTASGDGNVFDSGIYYIGDSAKDNITFTNTAKDQTITGILMNDMPMLLLLLLVGGSIAGYLILKRRKRLAA
jgi:hypothetical protein